MNQPSGNSGQLPPDAVGGGDGLLPCPFCGSPAERINFGPGSGENEGGSCVACTRCQASGNVEFGRKENFVSNWNRRSAQTVGKYYSLDADRAGIRSRVADCIAGTLMVGAQNHNPPPAGHWLEPFWNMACADAALAARQPVGAEPVAWQWRSRVKGGAWDAWENGRYGSEPAPFMEVEHRVVCTAPPAAAAVLVDLLRDAERFRWLMENCLDKWEDRHSGAPVDCSFNFKPKGHDMGAAIDAAMLATHPQPAAADRGDA